MSNVSLADKRLPKLLLALHFVHRMIILFTTELFEFSDYSIFLDAIDRINTYGQIPLRHGFNLYLISYIGYFFKYTLRSPYLFYVLNALIATFASYLIYYFIVKSTRNIKIGAIYLASLLFYNEFIAVSSIFYTQVFEICFISLLLVFLYRLHYSKSVRQMILYGTCISVLIILSLFFKGTMRYMWLLFFILSVINFKDIHLFLKYSILSLTIVFSGLVLKNVSPRLYSVINSHSISEESTWGYIFLGHTLYGGDGGEGALIYPENITRYQTNYENWLLSKSITTPSSKAESEFRKSEILAFIRNEPHKWLGLQFNKLARTYGVVPEGSTFMILFSGLFNYNVLATSLYLQIPVILIFILLLLSFEPAIVRKLISRKFAWTWVFLFIYFVSATTFYGPYQERYRIPVIVIFFLPALSYQLYMFRIQSLYVRRRLSMCKAVGIVCVCSIWSFQAYEALVVNEDRYLNYINTVRESDDSLRQIELLDRDPALLYKR